MSEPMMTVPQFADALECSARHVRRMIQRKVVAAVNIGLGAVSEWRIPKSEADRILTPTRPAPILQKPPPLPLSTYKPKILTHRA